MSDTPRDQDDFITLPPGIAPPTVDQDSATRRVTRRDRDEIVFIPTAPGAPVAVPGSTSSSSAASPVVPPAPEPAPASASAAASPVPSPVDEDDEATRFARRAAPSWRLTMPGHGAVVIDAPLYVGRNASVPSSDPNGHAIDVDDPGKSVSKTHARFDVADGQLRVTDLDSTNGVWIVPAGADAIEVVPGEATPVPAGADVELGDVIIQVEHG